MGFAALTMRLQPQDIVRLTDCLHALVDEAFSDRDIFIMERTSDGCVIASGLVETVCPEEQDRDGATATPFSMTDSSYGSEFDLDVDISSEPTQMHGSGSRQASRAMDPGKPPSHYASLIATAALKLMASSSRVQVPRSDNKQLQLRIALNSGPCSAGVIGLRTSTGTTRIPHYKLFGPTLKHAANLCSTGLALQIRVSKQCRDLLLKASAMGAESFHLERCPDYMNWASRKPVESYWLAGKEGLAVKLPSLDLAVSLSEYEDIAV